MNPDGLPETFLARGTKDNLNDLEESEIKKMSAAGAAGVMSGGKAKWSPTGATRPGTPWPPDLRH